MSRWPRYPKRSAISVKDGVKPRTASFGKAWWSRAWIQALENLDFGPRLARGRTYARKGQVMDYALRDGEVQASVQGSRRTPYKVRIAVKKLTDDAWEAALDALAGRAEYLARLLNGDMPDDIDTVFAATGTPLLPGSSLDLTTSCSCPDWANPCKHVAAVYYIVGEALDADPFLLMALRGRDREAVLAGLRTRRGDDEVPATPPESETEAVSPSTFWRGGSLEGLDVGLAPPPVHAAALRRLGPPGSWATAEEMQAVFGPLLQAASQAALEAAVD
jgi:uncharacterized Zn finger protein